MQDRSRAAATALCSGMSDSRLASAAATTGLRQAGSAKGIPFKAPGIASSKDQLKAGTHKRIQGSLGITCGCAVPREETSPPGTASPLGISTGAPLTSRWRRRRRGTRMPWILAMENGDEENRVNA